MQTEGRRNLLRLVPPLAVGVASTSSVFDAGAGERGWPPRLQADPDPASEVRQELHLVRPAGEFAVVRVQINTGGVRTAHTAIKEACK